VNTLQQFVRSRGAQVVTIQDLASVYHAAGVLKEHGASGLLVVRDRQVVGILTAGDIARRVVAEDCDAMTTRVREAMTENVVYGGGDLDLAEAADLADKHHVSHLPVLGPEGHLLGVVRRADLPVAPRRAMGRPPFVQYQSTGG